jgi:flagellar motor switch protein FliN/FliY
MSLNSATAEAFPPAPAPNLDAILNIPVSVQVVLGAATMPVASLMKLGRGAVIPLDHRVGQPVDIVVNGRVIARGEMIVLDEDSSRLGVSLTEVVGQRPPAPGL